MEVVALSQNPHSGVDAPSEVDVLVQRLSDISDAITRARALGVPAQVPEPLYEVCSVLVAQHHDPIGEGEGPGSGARPGAAPGDAGGAARHGGASARRTAHAHNDDDLARKVPLRRLLWQVITPGEEFTVTDVTERLERLGVPWPANKVSNALGYWASRNRLRRCRKGVYLYPTNLVTDDVVDDARLRESPVALSSRATTPAAGGKEHNPRASPTETRQAM